MAVHFHEEDLAADVAFDGPIAVDTEAMGLVPGRDRTPVSPPRDRPRARSSRIPSDPRRRSTSNPAPSSTIASLTASPSGLQTNLMVPPDGGGKAYL